MWYLTSLLCLCVGHFQIMALHRRRQNLVRLNEVCAGIQEIVTKYKELRNAIAATDYPTAIALCAQCQAGVVRYRRFNCVSTMRYKIDDAYKVIEVLQLAS